MLLFGAIHSPGAWLKRTALDGSPLKPSALEPLWLRGLDGLDGLDGP